MAQKKAGHEMLACARMVLNLRNNQEWGLYDERASLRCYWYSGNPNFGDWCGPHLLNRMTGLAPIQNGRTSSKGRILYSVGSILGWIKRNDVDVWGSGLMRPLTEDELEVRRNLTGVRIHAVRGKLTRDYLVDNVGWNVPEVYGDPALLLPRYYTAAVRGGGGRPVILPHAVHRKYFAEYAERYKPDVDIVDVRGDFRDVVDSNVNASAVVSSSLHGIIVAQAYGVPWIWLRVSDHALAGGDFKFDDFFTNLEDDEVPRWDVSSSDLESICLREIADSAYLPALKSSLDALEAALPVSAIREPDADTSSADKDSMPTPAYLR
jgi:hypothetical protein